MSATQQILQEAYVLATGYAASSDDLAGFERLVVAGDYSRIAQAVDAYMNWRASNEGDAAVLKSAAMNGLGLALGDAQADEILAWFSQSGMTTWSSRFAFCITNETSSFGQTLTRRGEAGMYLLDQLSAGGKSSYLHGPAVNNAVKNLLGTVSVAQDSLSRAEGGLKKLSESLFPSGIEGRAADGYVAGATVFADVNGNGIRDAGEFQTTTDARGVYVLPHEVNASALTAVGGIDLLTGKAFTGLLTAPAGSTVINPITSLLQALIADGSSTLGEGSELLRTALALPSGISLTDYDPLPVLADTHASSDARQTALAYQGAALQIANIVTHTAVALDAGPGGTSLANYEKDVLHQMAVFVSHALGPVNLSDRDVIGAIAHAAATSTAADWPSTFLFQLATITGSINAAIGTADDLTTLAQAATVAQGISVTAIEEGAGSGNLARAASEFSGENLLAAINRAEVGEVVPGVSAGGGTSGGGTPGGDAPGGGPAGEGSPPPQPSSESVWINLLNGTESSPASKNAGTSQLTLRADPGLSGYVNVAGFGADDAIVLSSSAQDLLSIASSGNDVVLVTNSQGTVNRIVLIGVNAGGGAVFDVASFNAVAVGDLTFASTFQPQTKFLDLLGGTALVPASTSALHAAIAYEDAVDAATFVRVTDFGSDDSIRFPGADASVISVSSQAGNVNFTINNGGILSSVSLIGVAANGEIVYDVNSFNTLPVGNLLL